VEEGYVGRDLLTGQTALVTGAGQGLGRVIAREFASEGAVVALLDRNPQTLEETRHLIESDGGQALPFELDVVDYDAYAGVVADVKAATGRIDILVNNAAIARYGTILEDTLEDWRAQIAVNLEAVYMGSKLVAPAMVERGYGRIISITSIQGFTSSGEAGPYNAAKGGIIAYTKSMAVELAPYGITANAIAPGFMRTPMSFVHGVDETTTDDFRTWYVEHRKVPMARTGLPEDISGTAVFLASDYCRYMTGQVLVVDGGLTSTF
jgi:3-oxoacyl-[acyl-carrier protein] reductase